MIKTTLNRIKQEKLIAEIRSENPDQAYSLVQAIIDGGIGIIEVALTIPDGNDLIRKLSKEDGILVGVGSVLTVREAQEAIGLGAKFISSPVWNQDLVPVCRQEGVACILSGSTPSEIYTCMRAGADIVKVFPTDALGGPAYIEEILKILPFFKIMVSGVRSHETFRQYVPLGVEAVALGEVLIPKRALASEDYGAISREASRFISLKSERRVA
jgi:2-dehydro-3-deoxyphosphogluconate aldolase/(4S)-4-hydroxy-2-oxoglutarate aldolase